MSELVQTNTNWTAPSVVRSVAKATEPETTPAETAPPAAKTWLNVMWSSVAGDLPSSARALVKSLTRGTPDWWATVEARLDEIDALRKNWNGRGAARPTKKARAAARLFLDEMRRANVAPERIVPTTDGGIGIYITNAASGRYVLLECHDGGAVVALSAEVGKPESTTWRVKSSKKARRESVQKAREITGR